MPRRKLGLGGSLALSCSLGLAVVVACNVYDSSLLTGGSEGQGGTSDGGEGSGGTSGTGHGGTGIGGAQGGGSGGSGDTGGTAPAGGTGTGGSKGGTAGMTGGTDPAGGDGGDPGTGGDAGSGAGSGGKAGAGNGGGGTNAGSGGSGGACGKCGCGKAETPDTDGDGVLDCNDTCTGFNDADCAVLKSGLVHRYSFDGTGTAVMDTKGTAHGIAMGTSVALSGTGTLVLAGGGAATADPKQYVDLPDDLLNGLTNATFEAFVTWPATGGNWQRIFDFGTAATNSAGSYAFLTPKTSTSGASRFAIATAGGASETATGGAQVNGPVIVAGAHHFVVSVDDTGDAASLYVDGTLGSTAAFTGTLSVISDVNNWLGRSNFAADGYFGGTFDEFRIYNVALTAAQLRTSAMAGPNATLF